MAWVKIPIQEQWQNTNDVNASGFVVKCYLPGTTTATPMAIDKNGGTTVSTATLNADGFPEVSGNEVALYIDREFKIAIYENAVDASNDNNAFWGPVDNITISDLVGTFTSDYWVDNYSTLRAKTSGGYTDGDVITVTDDGIAGQFVIKTGTVTDNGGTLIVFTDDSNRYAERVVDGWIDLKWFVDGGGVINDTAAFQNAVTAASGKCLHSDNDCTPLIDATITLPLTITLDLHGAIEFEGDDTYWFSSATANNILIINYLDVEGSLAFGSRAELNRAVFSNTPTLVHIKYAKITGASTNVDTSGGETLIVNDIEMYNTYGTEPQYGYGINSSSKRNIIDNIVAENDNETDGRHAVYINGGTWEYTSIKSGRFKNFYRNPVQITNTGTGNTCKVDAGDVVFQACNILPLTSDTGCVNVGSGGGTAIINMVVKSIRVDDVAGPAFGSLYSNLDDISIDYIEGRNLRTAAIASTSLCFIRNATRAHVGRLDCDALTTDWLAGLYFRDTTDADFDSVAVRGAGGSQAVRMVSSTVRVGQIESPTIDNAFDSGSSFTYKAIFDQQTFTASDVSPSVLGCDNFLTDTGTLTIVDFDDGAIGQEITVMSKGAVTYDVTGTNLNGGTTNIVTASGDLTRWYCEDGTNWTLIAFMNNAIDNS